MAAWRASPAVRESIEGSAAADSPKIAGEFCLLRRLEHRRLSRAELLEQRRLIGLRRHQMARLHMAEAADFLRNVREADGERVVLRRKLAHDLADQRLVVGDQLAL